MANFELETRVPMMIRVPWMSTMGQDTFGLAELVDMYPTLADLANLKDKVTDALDGISLRPLLEDPSVPADWKNASFSQYPRCTNTSMRKEPPYLPTRDPCIQVPSNEFTHMGYTVRTKLWRYTEWPEWECYEPNVCKGAVQWDKSGGRELYSHKGDTGDCFDCFENENVVDDPANAGVVQQLSAMLRAYVQQYGADLMAEVATE
eukprot:NODE_5341_length_706_cov_1.423143_g5318_i0.p1 GENE.NODE_5341_length_706_cov_1.423143_g5318_i0~~NODE_5341_length_706_cov_1.423143_g5318_i0.p1  ORF type:complete len:226 (+),score=66.12 NODE_5341_length_706_cov_1.423143_g5318_i0:65-679(+)